MNLGRMLCLKKNKSFDLLENNYHRYVFLYILPKYVKRLYPMWLALPRDQWGLFMHHLKKNYIQR